MAIKLGWDFNTSQAQPSDFVDELVCYWNAAGPAAEDTAGEVTPDWIAATRAQHAMKIKRYFA